MSRSALLTLWRMERFVFVGATASGEVSFSKEQTVEVSENDSLPMLVVVVMVVMIGEVMGAVVEIVGDKFVVVGRLRAVMSDFVCVRIQERLFDC